MLIIAIIVVGFIFGAVALIGTVAGVGDELSHLVVIVMETALYCAALAIGWLASGAVLSADWTDHLGNRIRIPEFVLLLPVSLTGMFLADAFDTPAVAGLEIGYTDITGIHLTPAIETVLFASIVIMGAHRVARITRETPPGGSRESLRGTAALFGWTVTIALVTLAFVWAGLDGLLASYPNPYEETYLWWWFDRDRLLALASLPTFGLVAWTTSLRGWHWLHRRLKN
ncbi:hypothetical protein [Haloarcula nitratireducens]|nr:hypothetical protein [Halomicroarcula nitratireducens]